MEVTVNWLAVVAASIANMAIGFAWYSDNLFGKQWRKLQGVSGGKPTQEMMMKMMGLGFGSALLMAFVLGNAMVFAGSYLKITGVNLGLMAGFWNWVGFMFPILLGGYLYEKKPVKLVVINSGYWLVTLLAMGVIIALWT